MAISWKALKERNDPPAASVRSSIRAASRVLAPVWPLATFAARSPWMGMEEQTFEETARWMMEKKGISIYPQLDLIHEANRRGDIDHGCLSQAVRDFLASEPTEFPTEEAERFLLSKLSGARIPDEVISDPEVLAYAREVMVLPQARIQRERLLTVSQLAEERGLGSLSRQIDLTMIKWCKLFLDETQSTWGLPGRNKGLYAAWRSIAPLEMKPHRSQLKAWPFTAEEAIERALEGMKVPVADSQDYLEWHLLALPGWAGMLRWRQEQDPSGQDLLMDYLAIRLSLEWLLVAPYILFGGVGSDKSGDSTAAACVAGWKVWGQVPVHSWGSMPKKERAARYAFAMRVDDTLCQRIWLEAWERTYAERLKWKLRTAAVPAREGRGTNPSLVQLAFCIDVRSEVLRRHLESAGPFETMGVAGFFGLPIGSYRLGEKHMHPSLPVILKPKHRIAEVAKGAELEGYQFRSRLTGAVMDSWKALKRHPGGSLLLPELSGPWLGLLLISRSLWPRKSGEWLGRLYRRWLRKPKTALTLDRKEPKHGGEGLDSGMTLTEQVQVVRQTLGMIGLHHFAPLVVFCGHGSRSTNNPYAAKLNCGACGGVSGGFNARVLAELCNKAAVREALQAEGINIPPDTRFAAAEHVTTTDELVWCYVPELSESAHTAMRSLEQALPQVQQRANEERLARLFPFDLGTVKPEKELRRYAEDWSEVRPEWGLARNAAFIIGRRAMTEHADLEGRVFLHSYDWRMDPQGDVLSAILSGPAAVTQWINLQYYASTVAPHYYGSGSKTTQTITSGIGVMQGNASDLMTGLPWQAVMKPDGTYYHDPLRLLVVIEAPRSYVERVLRYNEAFLRKLQGGWIRLASVDPDGEWIDWRV